MDVVLVRLQALESSDSQESRKSKLKYVAAFRKSLHREMQTYAHNVCVIGEEDDWLHPLQAPNSTAVGGRASSAAAAAATAAAAPAESPGAARRATQQRRCGQSRRATPEATPAAASAADRGQGRPPTSIAATESESTAASLFPHLAPSAPVLLRLEPRHPQRPMRTGWIERGNNGELHCAYQ
mmetsp:Transcript_28798/g.83133  ORF Transcript_28798/g.83133 Transcript_28798/m.83133 type:complete len:183 (+) Transcript_28798:494-1042(+)